MKKLTICLMIFTLLAVLSGCDFGQPEPETSAPTEPTAAETVEVTEPEPTEEPTEVTEPTEPPEIADTYFQVPQGFYKTVEEEGRRVYSCATEGDTSCIVVQTLPRAEVLSYTKREFAQTISGDFGRVAVNELKTCRVNGWDALYADYAMKQTGRNTRSFCYLLPADQVYSFTFMDATPNSLWTEAFREAASTIQLLEEGQLAEGDLRSLTRYDLNGMVLYAAGEFKAETVEGYHAALIDGDTVILLFSEEKSQVGEGFSLEEYAKAVTQANGLEECTWDTLGNLGTVFTRLDGQGVSFHYYLTVKESADSFWICQMACPEEQIPQYEEAFHLWSSTLRSIG